MKKVKIAGFAALDPPFAVLQERKKKLQVSGRGVSSLLLQDTTAPLAGDRSYSGADSALFPHVGRSGLSYSCSHKHLWDQISRLEEMRLLSWKYAVWKITWKNHRRTEFLWTIGSILCQYSFTPSPNTLSLLIYQSCLMKTLQHRHVHLSFFIWCPKEHRHPLAPVKCLWFGTHCIASTI